MTNFVKCRMLFLIASLSLQGCVHNHAPSELVVLDGYSKENFAKLNKHVGTDKPVCIKGNLRVWAADGVYFQLRPEVWEGEVDPGFSQVSTDISRSILTRRGLQIGSTSEQTICGTLHDSTPWPKCDEDDCRWYEIRGSVLVR